LNSFADKVETKKALKMLEK